MQLIPYLSFNGDCRAAFDFYRDVLGGEIVERMTWGESPMAADMPAETHAHVMHSQLRAGDAVIMGADSPGCGAQSSAGTGGCINISVESTEHAERIWAALSDGAQQVRMPLQPTFWAQRFGMLVDRFGQPWMVNAMPAA